MHQKAGAASCLGSAPGGYLRPPSPFSPPPLPWIITRASAYFCAAAPCVRLVCACLNTNQAHTARSRQAPVNNTSLAPPLCLITPLTPLRARLPRAQRTHTHAPFFRPRFGLCPFFPKTNSLLGTVLNSNTPPYYCVSNKSMSLLSELFPDDVPARSLKKVVLLSRLLSFALVRTTLFLHLSF
jgi:hypothetical protein